MTHLELKLPPLADYNKNAGCLAEMISGVHYMIGWSHSIRNANKIGDLELRSKSQTPFFTQLYSRNTTTPDLSNEMHFEILQRSQDGLSMLSSDHDSGEDHFSQSSRRPPEIVVAIVSTKLSRTNPFC